jgi:hypothetical protein
MAFELLTGNTLFAAETLPGIFAAHLSHDGNPPGLAWMREHSRHRPLGEMLTAGLYREPGRRLSIKTLRECLLDLGHDGLADVTWPIRP